MYPPLEAPQTDQLRQFATDLRGLVLNMAQQTHGAHVGGALSAADILTVLFHRVLRVKPDDPSWQDRDYFILSKGHIAAALYAVLAQRGFLAATELDSYAKPSSRLGGHPSHTLAGVEFTTGSLGHGLSLGIGLCLAARLDGRPNRTFVLMGDGELQEGSVYEAASAAPRFQLNTLTAIVDRNHLQINGPVEPWLPDDALCHRWRSFGWSVHVVDGHNLCELQDILADYPPVGAGPRLIIANTIKGKGVEFLEGQKKSHSVTLSATLHRKATAQLNRLHPTHS